MLCKLNYKVQSIFLKLNAPITGKHLCQSLFYNEVAGLSPATLLKKRLWYRCFPVNFVKLRTPSQQTLNVDSTLIYVEITS